MIDPNEIICGGVVTDQKLQGYDDMIQSKDIISFEYIHPNYKLSCKKNNNTLTITSSGAFSRTRDGSSFKLLFDTQDVSFLKKLQSIIEKDQISKNNGSVYEVGGLPEGLGDTISVEYESGEKIYKHSNQSMTITEEASFDIYDAFHALAIQNGYDFTTEKSNQIIYDDATEEFLQGSWKGKHFGKNIQAIFTNNQVQILVDGKETDQEEYIIVEGTIISNRLKEGKNGTREYDYEHFKGVSYLKKKNKIMLVAYFVEGGYSTCDLVKEN